MPEMIRPAAQNLLEEQAVVATMLAQAYNPVKLVGGRPLVHGSRIGKHGRVGTMSLLTRNETAAIARCLGRNLDGG